MPNSHDASSRQKLGLKGQKLGLKSPKLGLKNESPGQFRSLRRSTFQGFLLRFGLPLAVEKTLLSVR
jgi:hypothetical protein